MNLQSIITTNSLAITSLIILMISSHLVRQRRLLSDRLFTVMILLTAISCTVEMLTFALDGASFSGVYAINLLGSTFLYISNMALSFLWCVYVDLRLFRNRQRIRKYYPLMAIPAITAIIIILINMKFGYLFHIDENNVYHRSPLGSVFYLVTIFYFSCSIFLRKSYYKKFGKAKFFPIYMFIIPILLGATAQALIYGISLGWCAVSLGLVGIHMSLQNELAYIDPLTNIYNRNYLNHIMSEMAVRKVSTYGIMIDIDRFKTINDTYGHSAGDKALIEAASILKTASSEKATVIRFAGDEFIIIMHNANAEDTERTITEIQRTAENFNASGKTPYKISFSIGSSLYTPDISADKFFNQMDEAMYKEKNEKHKVNHR